MVLGKITCQSQCGGSSDARGIPKSVWSLYSDREISPRVYLSLDYEEGGGRFIMSSSDIRLFVDSSDPVLWERFQARGWVFGATTNPLILQSEGRACDVSVYRELVNEAKRVGLAQLQIQTTGDTTNDMVDSGLEIAGLWSNVVVKVPLTLAGLQAASRLREEGLNITLTAAYAAHQIFPALKLGAAYLAPYFGRLLDAGEDAVAILERMRTIRDRSGSDLRILVASLRTVEQVETLAALGHDAFTLSPTVAEQIGRNDLTDQAAGAFERAAAGSDADPVAETRRHP